MFFDFITLVFNKFQLGLFYGLILCGFILGYGLFKVRRWAYIFFFVYAFFNILFNVTHLFVKEIDLIPVSLDF